MRRSSCRQNQIKTLHQHNEPSFEPGLVENIQEGKIGASIRITSYTNISNSG